MVAIDEATVVEKGALGPGQMIAVDMVEGRLFHDEELKDELAAAQPFGEWIEKVVDLSSQMRDVPEKTVFEGADLRQRQKAAGYSVEELEQVLAPMAEDGKEMIDADDFGNKRGAFGPDTQRFAHLLFDQRAVG